MPPFTVAPGFDDDRFEDVPRCITAEVGEEVALLRAEEVDGCGCASLSAVSSLDQTMARPHTMQTSSIIAISPLADCRTDRPWTMVMAGMDSMEQREGKRYDRPVSL